MTKNPPQSSLALPGELRLLFVPDRTFAHVWQTTMVNIFRIIKRSLEEAIGRGVTVKEINAYIFFVYFFSNR